MAKLKKNLVKTFEAACKMKGLDPEKVIPKFRNYPAEFRKALIALAKLLIITDVVREGHVFNYDKWEEDKWYPWWYLKKDDSNSSGFRFDDSYDGNSASYVGARLCLRSEEEVEHMVKYFSDLYKDFITQ